jgi:hypothetical protein
LRVREEGGGGERVKRKNARTYARERGADGQAGTESDKIDRGGVEGEIAREREGETERQRQK